MLPFLDTMLLAKHLYRDLPNYGLDALADHLSIPLPASRHRALPDVELTAKIFVRMIGAWEGNERTSQLAQLIEVASIDVDRQPKPEQHSLFD
jgi:DNA polymerase-3 subunit epsilon